MKRIFLDKINTTLFFKAPNSVEVVGSITVVEGSNLSLMCSYEDGFPVGSESLFVWNNNYYLVGKVSIVYYHIS